MSCGADHRHSSDLALLRLWCRPAATAPIGPLAWEPQGCGPKSKKKKKYRNAIEMGKNVQTPIDKSTAANAVAVKSRAFALMQKTSTAP